MNKAHLSFEIYLTSFAAGLRREDRERDQNLNKASLSSIICLSRCMGGFESHIFS